MVAGAGDPTVVAEAGADGVVVGVGVADAVCVGDVGAVAGTVVLGAPGSAATATVVTGVTARVGVDACPGAAASVGAGGATVDPGGAGTTVVAPATVEPGTVASTGLIAGASPGTVVRPAGSSPPATDVATGTSVGIGVRWSKSVLSTWAFTSAATEPAPMTLTIVSRVTVRLFTRRTLRTPFPRIARRTSKKRPRLPLAPLLRVGSVLAPTRLRA